MSAPAQSIAQNSASPAGTGAMLRAVMGTGLLCGFVLALVYEATRPIIQRNRNALLEEAIVEVLPGATSTAAFRLRDDGSFEAVTSGVEGSDLVYAGYDEDHSLVGLAMVAQAMGYQDIVRVLFGYSFEREAVIGIRVLDSRETPGLGSRVETDPSFLANFERLDVRVNQPGDSLAHPIEFVKPGEKDAPWQIDGISGATITSEAIATMLRDSTQRWVVLVRSRRDDFRYQEGGR